MSISCELLAEPAVLPGVPNGPFFRFTPHADQRRLDRICSEIFRSPMVRTVFLLRRAASTVLPRPAVGFGSVIGFSSLPVLMSSLRAWRRILPAKAHRPPGEQGRPGAAERSSVPCGGFDGE